MRPIKKEYKRIGEEIKKLEIELAMIDRKLSLLSGGSSDPLPAGSGLGITKENHVANVS